MAVAVSALIVASFWGASPELKTYAPALLCAFFAVERVLCYFQKGGRGKLFVAGILLGTAACFKHDVAFYIMTAVAVALFTSWFGIARRRCSVTAGVLCIRRKKMKTRRENRLESVIAEAEVELMRRYGRIRELVDENAYLRERADALTAMLADADEKREYWRETCREFIEQSHELIDPDA